MPYVLYVRRADMTVRAYILITTRPGTSEGVSKELKKIRGIINAESVYGRFDVIALAEAEDHKTLNEIVYAGVGENPKVIHSEICFVLF